MINLSNFTTDFSEMLPHTVFISQKIGTDAYNAPTFGSSISHQARVVFGFKLVRNKTGEMVPASGTIWLQTRFRLKLEDKYEFLSDPDPSPNGYTRLFPIRVDEFPDENGFYFAKVYFE